MRKLGLVGGLGPRATVHYYHRLAAAGAGEMLLVHADVDRVLRYIERGEIAPLAAYLSALLRRLAEGGAEVGAVSAIAPHICIRELECISPIPIVSAIEAIREELRANCLRKVALFGTRFVIESSLFGMLEGTDVYVPPPEQVTEIHEAYMRAVRGEEGARETLCRIARSTPVDAIVLAGTDLSEVFDVSNTPFPFVDCTGAHVGAIQRALHQD